LNTGTEKFDSRSQRNLAGVHPDLVRVVERAGQITTVPFVVIEGVRTRKRQVELVKQGASQTHNSRHLYGMAVDLAAIAGNEIRWDWPLYFKVAEAMKQAANEEGVSITWGGDWRKFKDGPHFELARTIYPDPAS
jgi:peptidoglycan L-alanyl-D-glutamate endopeptidase CwlK